MVGFTTYDTWAGLRLTRWEPRNFAAGAYWSLTASWKWSEVVNRSKA